MINNYTIHDTSQYEHPLDGDHEGPSYTIDNTPPTVESIVRYNPASEYTDATSVEFYVTFSESVTGVGTDDFQVVYAGVTYGGISVDGVGYSRTVTVDDISGAGTLGLNLLDNDTIRDYADNHLVGSFTTGEVYTIVEVDILRGGTPITDLTSTVIVGQHIELSGVVQPAGLNITSKEWWVGGSRIKNYTQSQQTGQVTELEDEHLHSDNVDFYWILDGNNLVVTYNVTIAGVAFSAHTTFNVLRPTNVTLTSTTTTNNPAVDIGDTGFPGRSFELHFGTSASPGITWNAQVTTPAGGAGQIAFTQLIAPDRQCTVDDEGSTRGKLTSPHPDYKSWDYVLDDPTPYGPLVVNIGSGATGNISANDTPGISLLPALKNVYVFDKFEIYLMYKPNGEDSIWVTLRQLEWHWGGQAIKDTQTGVWSLGPGSTSSVNPGSSDSAYLPKWYTYFGEFVWVWE